MLRIRWNYLGVCLMVLLVASSAWSGEAIGQNETETAGTMASYSVDPLLIEGVYYLIVEQDEARALPYFRELLMKEPKNWEANYFVARILYGQIQRGETPTDRIPVVEQHVQVAQAQGLRFDRLHPNFRLLPTDMRGRTYASGKPSAGQRLTVKGPPALLLYAPDSDAEMVVQSADLLGYAHTAVTKPGELVRLESGQRYKLSTQHVSNWKAWTIPAVLAAFIVGVVAAR